MRLSAARPDEQDLLGAFHDRLSCARLRTDV